jgi:TetR/AcrR family transcriptional regulator, transcriptional repressor for nem operon
MARYSSEHKRQTRARILAASDALQKRHGPEGTSVDAVMRAAGLTVGGFYAHFASKDELERETLLHGVTASMDRLLGPLSGMADDRAWLQALIRRYLEQAEVPDLAAGCPLTLMLSEVARGGPLLQTTFAERTGALLDRVAARFPATAGLPPREVAIAVFASCAGAVAFARTVPAPHARRRILRAVETMLHEWLGLAGVGPAPSD